MKQLSILFYYTKTSKYPFHVLGGCLERLWSAEELPLRYCATLALLKRAIAAELALGRRVLVLWSFYSPEFAEYIEQLRQVRAACSAVIQQSAENDVATAELRSGRSVSLLPQVQDAPATNLQAQEASTKKILEQNAHVTKMQEQDAPATADVLHLVGGAHATAEARLTLEAGWDYVAVGEGERLLVEFVAALLRGETPREIRGLAHKQDGRPLLNGSAPQTELDDSPAFCERLTGFGPIEITRGCIYACKFCQTPYMFKARFRHRSLDNIMHWVIIFRDRGLRHLRFINPTCFSYGSPDEAVNLAAVEELLARSRETLGAGVGNVYYGSFPSECRPEHVTPEALRMLKKYVANDNLIIGGQTGSDRLLEASKRGHDVESIRRAVRVCRECGFKPNVDFIFGLPGENADDRRDSLALADELTALGARIHGHTFMPLPGTPYKNAAPGQISAADKQELDRLTNQGKLYGQWRTQQTLAARLHAFRQ